MKIRCFYLLITLYLTSCSRTYYIVRHAEKAAPDSTMNTDVSLSAPGIERAQALRDELKSKKLSVIYATNTVRARATAEPLSNYANIPITSYGPRPDSVFIKNLQSIEGNILVVGHSNTVDDIVNMLAGEKKIGDLDDNAYNNLFVIKSRGKGKIVRVTRYNYGK